MDYLETLFDDIERIAQVSDRSPALVLHEIRVQLKAAR